MLAIAVIAISLIALWAILHDDLRIAWRVWREMRSPETQRRIEHRVKWRAAQHDVQEKIEREVERRLKEEK